MSPTKPQALFDTVIVRLGGEIGIKSPWTRRAYQKRLIRNIKATLKHHNIPYSAVVRQQGRIYIKTSQAQQAALKLTKVFGISSLSPATQTTSKLEDITTLTLRLAKKTLKKQDTFAIKCKRVGTHPYTSRQVCTHTGQKTLEALPELQLKVNLTHPDVTIAIEIRQNQAYIYTETLQAPDGLPLGTQPKTITLIKPDLNSPVAAWLTMKRGCPYVPVHFHDNQSQTATKQVRSICKTLKEWTHGHKTTLYLIPHQQNLTLLSQKCPPHLRDILNRRLILRITAHIAEKEKAEAIVTGETIREKPSQTLRLFKLQDQAAPDYPVHRPLIGLTEAEIGNLAEKIGILKNLVTTPAKPRLSPAVLPTPKEIETAESKLPIKRMINKTLQKLERMTI